MVKSILVVTPHAAFGELIRLSLEENGSYRVTMMQSGSDAQKQAAQQPFDVAILDSEISDTPFPAIVQTIRSCRPSIKIVAALPSTNREDPALSGVVVDGYLRKPFYLPDLLGVIGRLTSDDFMSSTSEPDGLAALRDPRQATQLLARLLPESSALGALITQGNHIVAIAGPLSQPAANEVAGILEQTTRKTDLVRFIHLDNKDYQLFATTLAEDFMLAALFDATQSLTRIRSQVGRLTIALTTPPTQADRGPIPSGAYAPVGVTAPLVSRSFIPQSIAPTTPLTMPMSLHAESESTAEESDDSLVENIDLHELLPDVPPPDPDTLPQPDWLKELDGLPEATIPAPIQETKFPWEAETTTPIKEAASEVPAMEESPAEIKFPWEAEAAPAGQDAAPVLPSEAAAPAEIPFPWETETPASGQEGSKPLSEETPIAETDFPWETEAGTPEEPISKVPLMETKFPWENEEPAEPAPTPEKPPAPPDFLKAYREPTGELTPEAAPTPIADIPTFADTFVPPWEEQTQSADTKPESIPPAEEEPTLPAAAPFLDRLRSIAEAPQPSGAAEPATPSEATDKAPLFSDEFKLPWEEEPPAIMPEAAPLTPETTVPEQPTRAPAREEPFAQTASFLDRFKNAPEAPKQTIVEPAPEPVQPVPATTFPPGFVPPWEEVQQEQPVQNAQASQPEAPTTAEPVVMPDETKLPWEEDSTTAESVGTEPVTPEPESTEPVTLSPEAVIAKLTSVEPMASEAAPVEQPAAEPTATEQASVSGFPADFKPPWEEDTPAMGENPAETLPYPWEQAAPASSDVTQPMRVAGKPATQTPVEVTQPQAVLEPARAFEPPTLAMQTRPLQSPWMAKTHPLTRISDAEASGITQATYTCVIVPRSPLIHLAGNISDMLSEWVPQLCHSFGWRLDSMVVRFEYMQWTVTIAPSVSASDMIRILREHTSQRIFQNLPRLKPRNPAEEFWANGYLIVNGVEPPASEVLHDYIDQVHKRQSS